MLFGVRGGVVDVKVERDEVSYNFVYIGPL